MTFLTGREFTLLENDVKVHKPTDYGHIDEVAGPFVNIGGAVWVQSIIPETMLVRLQETTFKDRIGVQVDDLRLDLRDCDCHLLPKLDMDGAPFTGMCKKCEARATEAGYDRYARGGN